MSENKKLNFEEAKKIFHGIFDRGTQWEFAEVNGEHKELHEIDSDDWRSYGDNQDKAAKIFDDMKLGWKCVKIDDHDDDEIERDYFDKSYDYDDCSICIAKVDEGK